MLLLLLFISNNIAASNYEVLDCCKYEAYKMINNCTGFEQTDDVGDKLKLKILQY